MDPAILQDEDIATPVDLMSGEAGKPNPESNQITQRNKPQMACDRTVLHYAGNAEGDGTSQKSGGSQHSP